METIDADSYRRLEQVFIEGYRAASDTTLFLKLADIPFELPPPDGSEVRACLAAVRIEEVVTVGSVTPAVGSDQLVHHVLPHELVERRIALRFVYAHPTAETEATLAELRGLEIEPAHDA